METIAAVPHPDWLQTRPASTRGQVQLAAAIGCSLLAFGGLYPTFDNGKLAPLLAVLAAVAALVVTRKALQRRGRGGAVLSTFAFAAALGVVVPIVPAFVLAGAGKQLGAALMLAACLGAPVGLIYAIPLAILVGAVHPHLGTGAYASEQRVARFAGCWAAALCGLAVLVRLLGPATMARFAAPFAVPTLFAPLLCVPVFALAVALRAHLRLRRARSWGGRVVAGLEPGLRARLREPHELLPSLPQVEDGDYVIESLPVGDEAAYRENARLAPVCFL